MSKFSQQIAIGPEFFAKAKNDYASFAWALVREFMQNSMDCGSTEIRVQIDTVDGVTRLIVENNGDPMTHDVLVGKLLSLGSSGKDFKAGSVGGFGKAKEILYFCHQNYMIESGNFRVIGRGAGYNIDDKVECGNDTHLHGTRSTITLDQDLTLKLRSTFLDFCKYAQWDGKVKVGSAAGSVEVECSMRKGNPRREFEWGSVYTNKADTGKVVVRVGGIPMFTEWTPYDGVVIVELKGASANTLTSNRDGLIWKYRDEFQAFLSMLTTDKAKALRVDTPTYTHYAGNRLAGTKGQGRLPTIDEIKAAVERHAKARGLSVEEVDAIVEEARVNALAEEFIVKNETGMTIPTYYLPDSEDFGSYSIKLARTWASLMLELATMFEVPGEFAIGFVFSADAIAQHEVSGQYGTVYYINPAEIVRQANSQSKSFRKRWKFTDKGALIATAAHELVHGMGLDGHDEAYAAKYTEVMGRVLSERKRFEKCFK